ncbi:universal stress protein [Mycobacterium hackensackense]|uniref:universal stress protein n=1 Tax=Mycobacterium hackensackense TaxID=228909 RepID=UPI002265F087|nr:universal stress protein [Mycobacterium hackensackense]MCV7250876.1 universal stress protein [Mycobacterium hackensackense]
MAGEIDTPPVVAGIDGSDAAVNAALWAVDEATGRHAPLRLIYVIDDKRWPGTVHSDTQIEIDSARRALDRATEAVRNAGKPVTAAGAVLRGHPDEVLITESANASLVCIGSKGIGWAASKVLGSTAQSVAAQTHCPVAIIRHSEGSPPTRTGGVIVVGFRRAGHEDRVFQQALEEARLRHCALIAVGLWQEDFGEAPYDELERCVQQWQSRYPDVHAYPVASRADLPRFLADNADGHVQLAVIGEDDADQVANIVGPQGHSLVEHGRCSVLIAR